MTADTKQSSNDKAKSERGWFHAGSMLIGFFLGRVFINSASTLLQVNKSRQVLELTNTEETPIKVHHDSAAFWNSGELTIAPSQTMIYSFIDGDTMTSYSESGNRASGKVIVLKRRARTADARVIPSGEVAIQFTDE